MAYNYQDNELELDRGAELYDMDIYGAHDFGEQINHVTDADDPAGQLEDTFNEALADPSVHDQFNDTRLAHAAESDYILPDASDMQHPAT